MKKVLLLILMSLTAMLFAQEGIAYRQTKNFVERSYEVSQKFGKNKMKLMTISTGVYDTSGFVRLITRTKGNLTYAGKTVIRRDTIPNTWEIMNYNYMGNLADRWVRITEDDPREYTEIQYSSKGKITSKISVRVDSLKQHQWEFFYHELGYVHSYNELASDTSGVVLKKTYYDYGDNPIETTLYTYNELNSPLAAITYDKDDKIIHKTTYEYDLRNNLIKKTEFNTKGNEDSIEDWAYDDMGRLKLYNYYWFDGRFGGIPKLRVSKTYEYNVNIAD